MRTPRERDVERRLAELPAPEPPPGLASRVVAEIPDELAAGEVPAAGGPGRYGSRPWLAAAAALVMALGGGFLAWKLAQSAGGPGEWAAERKAIGAAGLEAGPARPGEPPAAVTAAPSPPAQAPLGSPRAEGAEAGAAEARDLPAERARRLPAAPREGLAGGGPAAPQEMERAVGDEAAPPAVMERPGPPRALRKAVPAPVPPASAPPARREARALAAAPRPVPAYARVDFDLQVRARFHDAGVAGAEVVVTGPGGAVRRATTDAHGVARLAGLAAGTYRVAGGSGTPAGPVEVAVAGPGAGVSLAELALSSAPPPADEVVVRATRGGQAVAGVTVVARGRGGEPSAVTGASGTVTFTGLTPGSYRLEAHHPEMQAPAPVDLVVGRGGGRVEAEMRFPGSPVDLRVRVLADGRAAPGATVVVRGPGREHTAATGAAGTAVVAGLPPGDYQVTGLVEGFGPMSRVVRVGASGGGDEEVALEMREAGTMAEEIAVTGTLPTVTTTASVGVSADAAARSAPRRREAAARRAAGEEGRQAATAAPPPPPEPAGEAGAGEAEAAGPFFQDYGVHAVVDASADRLSTFGLDVDTASYTLLRRYLAEGRLPPPAAVRVEEVVNALDYGDPAPPPGEVFQLTAEAAPSPFAPDADHRLLRFAIRARDVAPAQRRPADLVFVVDTSESMGWDGRIDTVKEALYLLLDELRTGDRVAVVAFAHDAWAVVEATADRSAVRRAVAALRPAGGTNAEAGLALGYHLAWKARRPGASSRVVLLSDGVANQGVTAPEAILARVAVAAADGIELTTVGVGMGHFDDVLLEHLADRGDGRYVYVDGAAEARRVFVEELEGTLETVAEEARAQVEFDPRRVESWRLLGYENRDLADETFRFDHAVDAAEVGAGQTVTVLYEVELRTPAVGPLALLKLRYRDPRDGRFHEVEKRLTSGDVAPRWEAAPASLRLAAIAAELAEQLRGSPFAEGTGIEEVARRARAVAAARPGDPRAAELADLAQRVVELENER